MTLYPSQALFSPEKPAKPIAVAVLRLFSAFRFVHLEWDQRDCHPNQRRLKSTTNLTILNAILVLRGLRPQQIKSREDSNDTRPTSSARINEYQLWCHVMVFQIFCSLCAFAVRYWLAAVVFP